MAAAGSSESFAIQLLQHLQSPYQRALLLSVYMYTLHTHTEAHRVWALQTLQIIPYYPPRTKMVQV